MWSQKFQLDQTVRYIGPSDGLKTYGELLKVCGYSILYDLYYLESKSYPYFIRLLASERELSHPRHLTYPIRALYSTVVSFITRRFKR